MYPFGRIQFVVIFLATVLMGTSYADETTEKFFREKIEAVLKRECYSCHASGAKTIEAGLKLDSPSAIRNGGDSGPAIDLEQPEESLLLVALKHESGLAMPPNRPRLSDQIVQDFRSWLSMGAPDPRSGSPTEDSNAYTSRAGQHWAFQPIQDPPLPEVDSIESAAHPIDAFLLSTLQKRQWQFAAMAEKRDWLRRVVFDVTGLPPTVEALEQFEADERPDAVERTVDRLLASPRYGERFAQLWLDVVRYAESEGYEYDRHLPDAWRYRDWVVDAFNIDKPFDRFVVEQVAGDELDPSDNQHLIAAVFHRLGPVRRNAGNPDIALSRNEVLTERTDILGGAFLGMTIGCARCHNHKLEPITQKDYYQLQAYLASTAENNISLAAQEEQAEWDARTKAIKDEIQELQQRAKKLEGEAKEKVNSQIALLDDQLPAPLPTIPSIRNDFGARTPIHVLRRGVWENKGVQVGMRPPSVLIPKEVAPLDADVPHPRTALAQWLVSTENPLTARVIVNRIWQHHFGTGIVKTANDFGLHGDPPSHPELLDWLASMLRRGNWETKPLHRAILLSRAYRQSTRSNNPALQLQYDPENRLLSSFSRRRLSGEETRDAMLTVSGQWNSSIGGPSVMLPVDPEMVQLLYKPAQWVVAKDPQDHARRSIYLFAKRNLRLPIMENLDAPALLCSCARRESSTHAPQALELMNGWHSNTLAQAFASRLSREAHGNSERIVELAFLVAIGRPPSDRERQLSREFLSSQPLPEFALAMFNLNEFLYVP